MLGINFACLYCCKMKTTQWTEGLNALDMKKRGVKKFLFLLLLFHFPLLVSLPCAASDPFPTFPCLESNVRFWVDAYTRYTTTDGIIHDATDLSIVYSVIDLLPPDKPGARRTNQARIRAAKEQYSKILKDLIKNGAPEDPEKRHIADLFGPEASADTLRKASRNIRCQVGQKDRFEEGLIRSGAYLPRMKDIFRSHGLPEDLCYLPHVESSFDLSAFSKAGAAGIWQFTRATGKKFLTVNKLVDERRDPIRATEAAAKLLKANYDLLGNWPMAVTAYNHGIAGMLRAKKRMGTYEEAFEAYNGRRFRFASRNFYPEFLAARHVAKNYTHYFSDIQLSQSLDVFEVVTKRQISVEHISRHYDVDLETLRDLNPALGKRAFKGQRQVPKGYVLRLPADSATDFILSSAELRQVYPDLRD
jgi:membrane-bound lytic murein transglycosylase D